MYHAMRVNKSYFNVYLIARRPPVEETTSFLNSLLHSHGPDYLSKLFGPKARHNLRELGGVNQVAIALSGKYIQRACSQKLSTKKFFTLRGTNFRVENN